MAWNLDEALSYYRSQGAPADQLSLKNLLLEIQQEHGGTIPRWVIPTVACAYQLSQSFLLAVIRRYPSLKLAPEGGGHLLELCGGPGCSKRGRLRQFVEQTYGREPKEFTLRITPCMHLCGQGPILRWDGMLYCGADEALIRKLVEAAAEESDSAHSAGKESK